MKALVIYDSVYGNTEKIARAIAEALGAIEDVGLTPVSQADPEHLKGLELLIIGAPTQGGKPTKAVQEFLNTVQDGAFKGLNVAAFDTRIPMKLVGIFGYAAGKIAENLKRKGGILISPPEGFLVQGSKGPLKEGEPERAANWARRILEANKKQSATVTM